MKLVLIPPYSSATVKTHLWLIELIDRMRKRGQLEGVQLDLVEGPHTDFTAETRNAEFAALISVGVIKKVREYSETGKYDGIVVAGTLEPGFFGARMVSKIPVAFTLHSAIHFASLIGDRCTVLHTHDPSCQVVRNLVDSHGFGHKVVSVRPVGHSSTEVNKFMQKYAPGKRNKTPEGKKIIDDIAAQCVAAIEKDRADTITLGCPSLQIFEDDVRKKLDKSGYDDIQLISELPAAVEMLKGMVKMGLTQAARAYPTDALKAKPDFR